MAVLLCPASVVHCLAVIEDIRRFETGKLCRVSVLGCSVNICHVELSSPPNSGTSLKLSG